MGLSIFSTNKRYSKRHKYRKLDAKVLYSFVLIFCAATAFFLARITFSASLGILSNNGPAASAAPASTPPSRIPPQTQAQRLKITIGETKEVPFSAEIKSAVVVSPEIASAHIKSSRALTITGLKIGETILIIFDSDKRLTFVVEVAGKPTVSGRQNIVSDEQGKIVQAAQPSGSYNALYVQGFTGNPSLLKQNIEYRRQLSEDKTLRVSAETFKVFGENNPSQAIAKNPDYGFNRVSVGIDTPNKTIEFLDSQVNVSPLSLNNYTMRGFHLVKTPKPSPNPVSKKIAENHLTDKGIGIFAGMARPSLAFFDNDQGWLAGANVPVAGGQSWQVRAGFITIVPQKNNRFASGGTVFQLSGTLTPNKNFTADGEIAYANSKLSLRARMELKLRNFGATWEIVRFDRNSPLNSISAQPGGRKTEALSFYWRPDTRFSAAVSYNHTAITRRAGSGLADFNRTTFFANASYRFNRNSRLFFRILAQEIETAIPGSASKFQIETRALTFGYNARFNQNLTNNFEVRLNFSREPSGATELEKGFNLSEQLRFSWNRNSVTGFLNYTYKTPSLMSLIVRNPQLLPLLLQPAFALNPAQFLQVYRDRVAFLLSGIELPQTRSLDTGFRFQTSFSRFALTGETRYNTGEILAQNQNNFFAALSTNIRLDAANSFQISGWRSFGSSNQSALSFSYTHRFGAEGGGGYQLAKLFGLDKGRVQGRVYYDLNGNGQDDAGEPGVAGMTVRLNEKRSAVTDVNGRYEFSSAEGVYNISLISDDLGVRLRASTATQQKIELYSRQTVKLNFGVMDYGFLSGVVFNDMNLDGVMPAPNAPGLSGVRVILRSAGNQEIETLTNPSGVYEFRNLRPGSYTLVIDSMTLPADFQLPAQTSWEITVLPLQGFYLDIPIAAQRAVVGIVFIDKDANGQFNPQLDEVVADASIAAGTSTAVSDNSGGYVLRDLPAGKVKLIARSPKGAESSPVVVEFGAAPATKREVNLAVRR